MQGDFFKRSPAEVVSDIRRLGESGTLRIEDGQAIRQLFIDSGSMIRFAASNIPSESLTAMFKSQGGLSDDHLRSATAAKKPQELFGTTLVRLGFLDAARLNALTTDHIRLVMNGVLFLTSGNYRFQRGPLPFRDQLDGGQSVVLLLLQWARGLDNAERSRRHFGGLDRVIRRSESPADEIQSLPLDATEGFALSRLDVPTTLRDLCALSPIDEETTLKAIYGLRLAGLVELNDETPHTRAPQPAGTPPSPARSGDGEPASAPSTGVATSSGPRVSTAAVLPGRIPGNGGSPAAAPPKPAAAPKSVAAPGPAAPDGKPAAPKPRVVTGRTTPAASPAAAAEARISGEIEMEMLERFDRLNDQNMYEVLGVEPIVTTLDIRRAYYALARKLHPDKFRDESMKAKAEKVFGRITEAYSTLSKTEPRQKYDTDLAMRTGHGRKEEKVDPSEMARMNFKRGKDSYARGRYPQALSFLENACKQDDSKGEYFQYLGMTQAHNPRLRKQAEESLQRALKLSPSNADAYAHLGSLFKRAGQIDRAHKMYRQALQWDATNAEALSGMADDGIKDEKKGFLGMFSKK
jgi:curved DNA-binding protein CbpA